LEKIKKGDKKKVKEASFEIKEKEKN